MKAKILFFSIAMCISCGMAWGQTSYGGLIEPGTTAGNGGNNTNSYFGDQAGESNTGTNNTFIGHLSGHDNTGGEDNTFLGSWSGYNNTFGDNNTFIGRDSGESNSDGSSNTFVGNDSGDSNTTGNNNTFIGDDTGQTNGSGSQNTFIGTESGFNNFTGSNNVFLGYRAGYNELGSDRLYIDNSNTSSPLIWGNFTADSLRFNGTVRITDIPENTTNDLSRILVSDNDGNVNWRGASSLAADIHNFSSYPDSAGDGGDNTNAYFGHEAGLNNNLGDSNTFIGYQSGYNNTGGYSNTFLGRNSGYNNQTGSGNVFLGHQTGLNELGSDRLYIDNSDTTSPLLWGNFASDILNFNGSVGVGLDPDGGDPPTQALDIQGTARLRDIPQNNALERVLVSDNDGNISWRAGSTLGDSHSFSSYPGSAGDGGGNTNAYFGHRAGANNTGTANTFIGYQSGRSNTTGNGNTANGYEAFLNNNDGADNTAMGYRALYFNDSGNDNVAVGRNVLQNNSTGSNNIALGRDALTQNTTGNGNIAIGYTAGPSLGNTNLQNTVAIGYEATVNADNAVRIGNFEVEDIGGVATWTVVSDGRFKINVEEDVAGLDFIKALRPVSYNLDRRKIRAFTGNTSATNSDISRKIVGFIAQEVEATVSANNYVFTGVKTPVHEKDHYGLKYAEFVVPLVKGMQEQQQLIENQQELIENLQQELIENLQQEIETLKNSVYGPGTTHTTQAKSTDIGPEGFALHQNMPNPFHRATTINATVPEHVQQAKIVIYNLNGLELESYIINERGNVSLSISGGRFPSGMYIYALIAGNKVINTKKMILTR